MKRIILNCLVCFLIIFAFSMILPETHAYSELEDVYGGECKPVCKKGGGCSGKADCPGNCTGADSGAGCGSDFDSSSSTNWGCGEAEGGGGCNLSGGSSKSAKKCECLTQRCSSTSTDTTCTVYSDCSTD